MGLTTSLIDIGLRPYRSAWSLQEELREARRKGEVGDLIVFCEHHPVYTLGKQNCDGDILTSFKAIERDGIEVVCSNRGGRITYHGPGQLVVYFIVKISNFSSGIKGFVALIEDASLDLMFGLGLNPSRKENYPGIWLGDKKVAAVGLNISRGISVHGMSINVEPDMSHYRHIIPCGIKGFGVTSLAQEMGPSAPSVDEVKSRLVQSIEKVFGCKQRGQVWTGCCPNSLYFSRQL